MRASGGLCNTASTLSDPEFEQSRDARNRQTTDRRDDVSPDTAASDIRDEATGKSEPCADRGDHVADPVNQVEKRALGLRTCLTLNSHDHLWSRAQIQGEQPGLREEDKAQDGP